MITNYYTAWPNRKIIDMHSHLEMICHNPIYVKIWSLNSTSIQYIYTTGSHVYCVSHELPVYVCGGGDILRHLDRFHSIPTRVNHCVNQEYLRNFAYFHIFLLFPTAFLAGFLEIVYCLGLGQGWVNSYRCRENTSTAWESRQISSMSAGLGYTDSE